MSSFLHDPKGHKVSRKEINDARNRLEDSVIEVGVYHVDCSDKDMLRMQEAVDCWDDVGEPSIEWTMGDNTSVSLNKAEFKKLCRDVKVAKSKRSRKLHKKSRELKAGSPTARDILPSAWL